MVGRFDLCAETCSCLWRCRPKRAATNAVMEFLLFFRESQIFVLRPYVGGSIGQTACNRTGKLNTVCAADAGWRIGVIALGLSIRDLIGVEIERSRHGGDLVRSTTVCRAIYRYSASCHRSKIDLISATNAGISARKSALSSAASRKLVNFSSIR